MITGNTFSMWHQRKQKNRSHIQCCSLKVKRNSEPNCFYTSILKICGPVLEAPPRCDESMAVPWHHGIEWQYGKRSKDSLLVSQLYYRCGESLLRHGTVHSNFELLAHDKFVNFEAQHCLSEKARCPAQLVTATSCLSSRGIVYTLWAYALQCRACHAL